MKPLNDFDVFKIPPKLFWKLRVKKRPAKERKPKENERKEGKTKECAHKRHGRIKLMQWSASLRSLKR